MKQTDWYKNAIIYQIYPKSFKDSNNDGIGDIKGIIEKLDYLKSLGVNCVWLCPVYESPMADNGYDVSNYYKINPMFGTMDDFKLMIEQMHNRGIKLVMDLVANHTSNEHEWFLKSRESEDNEYRDYYIWRKKPTNWTGFFATKAWEYDKKTDSYYLHLFGKKQPDLNWENPKVRDEIKKIIKFYLDMGVDGFRCDVINLISKDQRFKNGKNPVILKGMKYFINGPRLHEYLKELNRDVFSKYDCLTVGETVVTGVKDVIKMTDVNEKELSMVFNFDHTSSDNFFGVKWFLRKFKLKRFKRRIDKYQYALSDIGWNSLFYENHDQRRSIGRFNTCDGKYRVESAKMLATTMYFLKGTPFIYQGQEIGMTNYNAKSLNDFNDIESKDVLKLMIKFHLPKWYINKSIRNGSRDNSRLPMQWDDSQYAGFSTCEPWIHVNNNKNIINVKASENDEESILNFYKELIAVHKKEALVLEGKYKDLLPNNKYIFAYERRKDNELLLVISNFSNKERKIKLLNNYKKYNIEILLNNYKKSNFNNKLLPYQAVLLKLSKYNNI